MPTPIPSFLPCKDQILIKSCLVTWTCIQHYTVAQTITGTCVKRYDLRFLPWLDSSKNDISIIKDLHIANNENWGKIFWSLRTAAMVSLVFVFVFGGVPQNQFVMENVSTRQIIVKVQHSKISYISRYYIGNLPSVSPKVSNMKISHSIYHIWN